MSSWINPKTNWSASDYINYSDLNRVENNTKYVHEQLNANGYYVEPITTKVNWSNSDIVFFDDMNRIEGNIEKLAQAYFTSEEFEELKTDWVTLDPVSFDFANRIEKDLEILNILIESMKKYFTFCGVSVCGQSKLWQQRFRRY